MEIPNLELLLYKAKIYLQSDERFLEKLKKVREENKYTQADFSVETFTQVWGSTCTGFDVYKNGEAAISGSAMTEAYTTIVTERVTGTYVVFFDNRICYGVFDENATFLEDKKNHLLKSLSQAKQVY